MSIQGQVGQRALWPQPSCTTAQANSPLAEPPIALELFIVWIVKPQVFSSRQKMTPLTANSAANFEIAKQKKPISHTFWVGPAEMQAPGKAPSAVTPFPANAWPSGVAAAQQKQIGKSWAPGQVQACLNSDCTRAEPTKSAFTLLPPVAPSPAMRSTAGSIH
jgi:hypothetical protein